MQKAGGGGGDGGPCQLALWGMHILARRSKRGVCAAFLAFRPPPRSRSLRARERESELTGVPEAVLVVDVVRFLAVYNLLHELDRVGLRGVEQALVCGAGDGTAGCAASSGWAVSESMQRKGRGGTHSELPFPAGQRCATLGRRRARRNRSRSVDSTRRSLLRPTSPPLHSGPTRDSAAS